MVHRWAPLKTLPPLPPPDKGGESDKVDLVNVTPSPLAPPDNGGEKEGRGSG